MTIAVHMRIPDDSTDPANNFHYCCLILLAARYPRHHFIFIFDKPYPPGLITQENITAVVLSPQVKNSLLQHFWYNFKLPRILNKYQADVFITNGTVCSLRSGVQQCMVINDLSFLETRNLFVSGEMRYLKKFFRRFVAKASSIVLLNQQDKQSLTTFDPLCREKITVTRYGIHPFPELVSEETISQMKDKYAAGKEYFLAFVTDASIDNTMMFLKAFSLFKKRQLSNMHLLLLLSSTQKEGIIKDFENYRYRNEVKLMVPDNREEERVICAASYAGIYLPLVHKPEGKELLLFTNNIPMITLDHPYCKSQYEDVALFSQATEKSIAENMMLLYKDENLRSRLQQAGKLAASANTWEQAATKLGQVILDTEMQTA